MEALSPPRFVVEGASLAERTTLGVGGPARYLATCTTAEEIREALAFARAGALPVLVLGGGSNLLVADAGFPGLVLQAAVRGVAPHERGADVDVHLGAGEPWDAWVEQAVSRGWAGLECLAGIPGGVGATPIQNVGAYGQEVGETITRVDAIERATGEPTSFDASACAFAYRDSFFKRAGRDRFVVTGVTFRLRVGGAPAVRYPELARALGDQAPTLEGVRALVVALRRKKSMVLDLEDENRRSAGSFFTNPILPRADAERARAKVEASGVLGEGEAMPWFESPDDHVKLSAAWLIERAGFGRGTARGDVGISTRHSLAIVNRGGATATAILDFARWVRDGVAERFGVRLVPEPELVGFSPRELGDLVGEADLPG